jgi:hypothetical protein
MLDFLKELRALRIIMACTTLLISVSSRFTGTEVYFSGWNMVPTLIIPAIVPILFFVLLLDVLMTWVFRVDAEGSDRIRLGRILIFDISLVVLLVISWAGYFNALAT